MANRQNSLIDVFLQGLLKLVAKFEPGPMQSAANGSDGKFENLGDRVVAAIVDFAEDQNGSMFFAQRGQRGANLLNSLPTFDPLGGGRARIGRLLAQRFPLLIDAER